MYRDGGNDSGEEVGAIWNAIEEVAAETNVDHRFILAVILQESGGCVRVSRPLEVDKTTYAKFSTGRNFFLPISQPRTYAMF